MPGTERESAAALCARANQLIGVRRARDAVALLRQALVIEPQSSRAHCLLAVALLQLGDARAALDAASHGDLATEWPHRLRSIALIKLRKKRAALAAARESIRLAPESPETLVTLIDAEIANRLSADAHAHALVLVRIAPASATSHHALGNVCLHQRKWPEAEKHFRRALELDPTSWKVMNNLALTLRRQGRHEEAIARFHDAARLQPTSKLVQKNLAGTITRYVGSGFTAIWIGLQVVRVVASNELGSPAGAIAAVLAVVVVVVWYSWRSRRLDALSPTVRAFYADYRGTSWRRGWWRRRRRG